MESNANLAAFVRKLYYGRGEMTATMGKSWHFASLWERLESDRLIPFALLAARRAGTNEVVGLFSRGGISLGSRKPNTPELMTVSHDGQVVGSLTYEMPLPWFGNRIAHVVDRSGLEFGSIHVPTVNSRHQRTNSVWTWDHQQIKPLFDEGQSSVEHRETPPNILAEAEKLVALKVATRLRAKCRVMFQRQPDFETPLCEDEISPRWNQINPALGLFVMTWARSFR
ncbi:hypothetical protein [Planctomicrobium piriforme]|uniref:Uncharacterized protein n=1 Tax=Planctomicrobium piriforme TaxID=1576369 RepID=A0A1I3F634_9PLAN|nr:hypothetical protein [Planctomicrobium piriforme]SFI06664.1 hypothetical protein SAMN05421753_10599 [Planctomicrobium piriforme]